MIPVTPSWSDQYWSRLLEQISVSRVEIPSGTRIFVLDWENEPLTSPPWHTFVSLVDTTFCKVAPDELNPKIVKQIEKLSKNWTLDDLEREMKKCPRSNVEDTMDREIQVGE